MNVIQQCASKKDESARVSYQGSAKKPQIKQYK
jgi:hypothetical protein